MTKDSEQTQRDERFRIKPASADHPVYSIGYVVQLQSSGKTRQAEPGQQEGENQGRRQVGLDDNP